MYLLLNQLRVRNEQELSLRLCRLFESILELLARLWEYRDNVNERKFPSYMLFTQLCIDCHIRTNTYYKHEWCTLDYSSFISYNSTIWSCRYLEFHKDCPINYWASITQQFERFYITLNFSFFKEIVGNINPCWGDKFREN